MRDDQHIQSSDIAQLLWKGHLRRSADLGPWLKQYFAGHRQNAQDGKAKSHLLHRIISLTAPTSRRPA